MLRWLLLILIYNLVVGLAFAETSRPITANDLVGIQDIGGHHSGAIAVSPNGRYVAFQLQSPNIAERSYDLAWYVAEVKPNGKVRYVGDGGELILNPSMRSTTNGNRPPVAPVWTEDGQWIMYLKQVDGRTQIWRSSINGVTQEQLTFNQGDVLGTLYQLHSPPSFKYVVQQNILLYSVAKDPEAAQQEFQEEADRGFLFDDRFRPATSATTPIASICEVNAWGRPEEVRTQRACEPEVWAFDLDEKLERPATPEEISQYYSPTFSIPKRLSDRVVSLFQKSENDDRTVWLENEDPVTFSGSGSPVRLFASSSAEEFRCGPKECEAYSGVIEDIWFRPQSAEIIFQRADGTNKSMTGLYAWNPDTDNIRTILFTEDKLDSCEIMYTHAICLREQWTQPRTLVSINLVSGEIQTIYDPNPQFKDIEFSRVEKFEWTNKFNEAAHGHLVYPLNYEKQRRYPLVIVTYRSRGFLRGNVGDEYPIHLLAASGFMVLSFDKPRSYKRFAEIDDPVRANFENLHERQSSLSAQERILDILAERGLVDQERTAITGLSDGADQVRFALVDSDRFTTGIASGAFNYEAHYHLSNENWQSYWERLFDSTPDNDEHGYWRAHSLWQNISEVNEPYLANVSDMEFLPSVEQILRLQKAGRPVEMYVFPSEYHIKWQPQHRLAIYRRNVQWLKFWLMGVEESDPVSPGQYERWRKMRDQRCAWDEPKNEKPIYCESSTSE